MPTVADLKRILNPEECEKVLHLYKAGKLVDDWANVADHCAAVAFTTHELAILRGFPRAIRWRLVITAACHDARKRLEKFPDDFTPDEIEEFECLWRELDPDPELMAALLPSFHLIEHKTDGQDHIWYADDLCIGNRIVRFKERIAEVSVRNPDPDPEVTRKLRERYGSEEDYWFFEEWYGRKVEERIFGEFVDRHVAIKKPEEIPDVVRLRIEARLAYHATAH